jgi:AAA family ATP:ADP antiporter
MAPFSVRNLVFVMTAYFLVLLNYSMVRAAATTEFINTYGAKASPAGWLGALVLLVFAVGGSNRLQARVGFHRAFLALSVLSVGVFAVGQTLLTSGVKEGAFLLFTWKETYIVMQVHLLLAYANSWLGKKDFLKWVGPIGAAGGLGGTVGGLLTGQIARTWGTTATLGLGMVFVLLPALVAFGFDKIPGSLSVASNGTSPLRSIAAPDLRRYVWSIAIITALTQFVINIADFQFSVVFEQALTDSSSRTAYLGQVYTVTNALTLLFQLVILPLGLKYVPERGLHVFIPLSYLVCFGIGLGMGAGSLFAAAGLYVFMKASDYSIFSSAKELLYHPLAPLQKFGAKYLTDMIVYRAAKGAIAALLLSFHGPLGLNVLMVVFLALWVGMVYITFRQHRRLFSA